MVRHAAIVIGTRPDDRALGSAGGLAFVATDGREIAFQLLGKKSYDEVKDRLENPPHLADDDEVQFFYHWTFAKFEEGREPGGRRQC